jgi:hypothetical protein
VYPNPVTGNRLNCSVVDDYKIFSTTGILMSEVYNTSIIDLDGFQKGAYLIRNKQGSTVMFIVR